MGSSLNSLLHDFGSEKDFGANSLWLHLSFTRYEGTLWLCPSNCGSHKLGWIPYFRLQLSGTTLPSDCQIFEALWCVKARRYNCLSNRALQGATDLLSLPRGPMKRCDYDLDWAFWEISPCSIGWRFMRSCCTKGSDLQLGANPLSHSWIGHCLMRC